MTPTATSLQSLMPVSMDNLKQEDLLNYFKNSWELNNWLFTSIRDESSYYIAPDPLRHPLIFYLGHTAVFYVNKLRMAGLISAKGINREYERLFEQGVDPKSAKELDTTSLWPAMEDVVAYRKQAYELVCETIEQQTLHLPIEEPHAWWSLMMGLEHDRIHFETSSVLIRQYQADLLDRPEGWQYAPAGTTIPDNAWIQVAGGEIRLGKDHPYTYYGWDDQYGYRLEQVAPFQAQQNLITNGEFLEFVKTGGYQQEAYWSAEGWSWINQHQVQNPRFWVREGDTLRYRAMFDEMDLPLDWPVELNYLEAEAFCRWKGEGIRMMTEAEFRLAAADAPQQNGEPMFSGTHNLNIRYGSPTPVGHMTEGKTAQGFNDLYGNVWDWTSSPFAPLPGFRPHPLYLDYSQPAWFGDEKDSHNVLLGGSWATSGTSASKYYRQWFRRYFYQHAGFRLCKSL